MNFASILLVGGVCLVAVTGLPLDDTKGNLWEKSGKFEGDILLDPSQITKNGLRPTQYRWTGKILYYTIAASFSAADRAVIMSAITTYNNTNCVKMLLRTTQTNYVSIINTNAGCYSNLGMSGGAQVLNLGTGCVYYGIVCHELMHALGFWHMHSTWNRDSYVKINYGNIIPGKESNFDKYNTTYVNDFGVAYDYGSVMHYSNYAFSSNNQMTIVPIPNSAVVIGQRNGLSAKDILKLRLMYGCSTTG